MFLKSYVPLLSTGAAALVIFLGCPGSSLAADQPVLSASPTSIAGITADSCPTCSGAQPGCQSCRPGKPCGKHCKPYVTQLCPGACFGYFQTQWHRWENVCPIPYQGVGQADSPGRVVPSLNPPGSIPPADPKTKGSDQPLSKPATLPGGPGGLPIPPVPDRPKN